MEKQLEDIKEKLDIIISLMTPPFSEEKYDIKGESQLAVLKLCDGTNTKNDIVKKLGKTKKSIEMALDRLSKSGIIKTIKQKEKFVYLRVK